MTTAATVTVLITDLVGSTQVRVAVGEAMADRLRREHDQLVTEEITRHGGTVVKGTGDGIIATFVGAADAVAASVAVHQALHEWDAGEAGPRSVRIGISAGDVTWDDGDCFGTPIIEASRLTAAASGGQTLVADVVRVLARGRHGQTLVAVGALDLKGLPEPVTTYEVTWSPRSGRDDGDAVPLPAAMRVDAEFPFVGRAEQLGRLLDDWSAVVDGASRLALIGGEPGIGKTRLTSELARAAHDDGGTVLYDRCDDDLDLSYQPFVEALQHFVDHSSSDALTRDLGRYAGDLVRLCPDIGTAVSGLPPALQSDPDVERRRLFDAVAEWLRGAAEHRPIVLVVEDAHWAATPALAMLRYVARSLDASRVFIVVTYRDTELGRTHPLADVLAALREAPGVDRMSLGGLDEHAVGALLDADDEPDLARAVYAETEGNPFFAREVVRHLRETGAITRRDGRWKAGQPLAQLGIPEGVREVVGRRLARLSEPANEACSIAAVIGNDFDLSVLAAVAPRDEDDLVAALDEAVVARLLTETGIGTYRFAHALVRSTLYDELGLTARVRMHRRVGVAIETVAPDDVTALAYHFGRAAAAGEELRAARYGMLAARKALDDLAVDQARVLANDALALLDGADDESLRCDLLTCRGIAERLVGAPEYRETLIAASRLARSIGDTDRLVAAVIANVGGVSDVAGFDAERVEFVEAALAAMPESDSAPRARLLAALAYALGAFIGVGRARAFELADEAVAMARRVGDPRTLTVVLHHYYDATLVPDTLDVRLATTAENLAIAEGLADPVAIGWALQDYYLARVEIGEISGLLAAYERIDALRAEFDLGQFGAVLPFIRAAVALVEGRLDEAEAFADDAFRDFTAKGHPSALLFYFGQLMAIRRDQGRLAELMPAVEEAAAQTPELPALQAARLMMLTELERGDDARELLEVLVADDLAFVHRDWLWLQCLSNLVEAAAWLEDRAAAAVLLERLAPYDDRIVMTVVVTGAVARFAAMAAATLERFDEAERFFAKAEAMETKIGGVICLARTHVAWARMLRARAEPGDDERAHALAAQALATARSVGLPTVERAAAALLA